VQSSTLKLTINDVKIGRTLVAEHFVFLSESFVKRILETKKDNAEISNKKKNTNSFALYQRFFYAIIFFVLLLEFLVDDESRMMMK
jgi:hypothetical protein